MSTVSSESYENYDDAAVERALHRLATLAPPGFVPIAHCNEAHAECVQNTDTPLQMVHLQASAATQAGKHTLAVLDPASHGRVVHLSPTQLVPPLAASPDDLKRLLWVGLLLGISPELCDEEELDSRDGNDSGDGDGGGAGGSGDGSGSGADGGIDTADADTDAASVPVRHALVVVGTLVMVEPRAVQAHWAAFHAFPCGADLLHLLTACNALYMPGLPIPPPFAAADGACQPSAADVLAFVCRPPLRFAAGSLFAVPQCTVLVDVVHKAFVDASEPPQVVVDAASSCEATLHGGLLVGRAGAGKLRAVVQGLHVMRASSNCAREGGSSSGSSSGSKTCATSKAVLLLVPQAGVLWRAHQLRTLWPSAAIVTASSAAELLGVTWASLQAADYVITSAAALNAPAYTRHRNVVLHNLAAAPGAAPQHATQLLTHSVLASSAAAAAAAPVTRPRPRPRPRQAAVTAAVSAATPTRRSSRIAQVPVVQVDIGRQLVAGSHGRLQALARAARARCGALDAALAYFDAQVAAARPDDAAGGQPAACTVDVSAQTLPYLTTVARRVVARTVDALQLCTRPVLELLEFEAIVAVDEHYQSHMERAAAHLRARHGTWMTANDAAAWSAPLLLPPALALVADAHDDVNTARMHACLSKAMTLQVTGELPARMPTVTFVRVPQTGREILARAATPADALCLKPLLAVPGASAPQGHMCFVAKGLMADTVLAIVQAAAADWRSTLTQTRAHLDRRLRRLQRRQQRRLARVAAGDSSSSRRARPPASHALTPASITSALLAHLAHSAEPPTGSGPIGSMGPIGVQFIVQHGISSPGRSVSPTRLPRHGSRAARAGSSSAHHATLRRLTVDMPWPQASGFFITDDEDDGDDNDDDDAENEGASITDDDSENGPSPPVSVADGTAAGEEEEPGTGTGMEAEPGTGTEPGTEAPPPAPPAPPTSPTSPSVSAFDYRAYALRMQIETLESRLASLPAVTDEAFVARLRAAVDTGMGVDPCVACRRPVDALLTCGHTLCSRCASDWLARHDTCPICMCTLRCKDIVACEDDGALARGSLPVADAPAAAADLWRDAVCTAHSLSTTLWWFVAQLLAVQAAGRVAVIVTPTLADARALVAAATAVPLPGGAAGPTLLQLRVLSRATAASKRSIGLHAAAKAHLVVTWADVQAGAGLPGVTDVLVCEPAFGRPPANVARDGWTWSGLANDVLCRLATACTTVHVMQHAPVVPTPPAAATAAGNNAEGGSVLDDDNADGFLRL